MAQPQHGPVRSEVSDLQNIVDRLDLLMGSTGEASADSLHGIGETARAQIDDALTDLTSRVNALEREAEELRTLVNHLMTIATWQAKVTATLVGEDDQDDDVSDENEEAYASPGQPQRQFVERVGRHVEPRRPDDPQRGRRPEDSQQRSSSPTLDEDIDDILGADREPSGEDGSPPPDFGI